MIKNPYKSALTHTMMSQGFFLKHADELYKTP